MRGKIFTQDRYSSIVAIRDLDRGRDRVEIAFTVIPGQGTPRTQGQGDKCKARVVILSISLGIGRRCIQGAGIKWCAREFNAISRRRNLRGRYENAYTVRYAGGKTCFRLSRPVINDCVNARHIINEGKDLSKTISPIFFEHLTPSLFRTIRLYVKLVEKRNHAFPNLISKYRRNEFRSVDA